MTNTHLPITFIAVGSNLGDRESLIDQAVDQLLHDGALEPMRLSPLYENAAVGLGEDAPPFFNGVLEATTALSAADLLHRLLAVEQSMGRVRSADGASISRTIDLDLLLFGDHIIDAPELQVPHPRMAQRCFVLQPLADLRPELTPPGQSHSVGELLRQAPVDVSIRRVRDGKQWTQ